MPEPEGTLYGFDSMAQTNILQLSGKDYIDAESRPPKIRGEPTFAKDGDEALISTQVNLDEVREHNRQLADGSVVKSQKMNAMTNVGR